MQLEIAAYGWLSAEWDSFYPDDLPPEWRLDYYANEFSAVIVPAQTWQGESIDEASRWLEEAPSGFNFFWELDDADGAARLLELMTHIVPGRGQVAGWLFQSGLRLEHGLFEALASALPGAAFGASPLPLVQAEQLAAEGITLCWEDGEQLNCRGTGLRVLQLASYPDLRQLRQIIEEQAADGTEKLLIMIKPGAVTTAQMHDLLTLITLFNG